MAGAAKRIEREKLFADAQSWNTGRAVRSAFHKPNDYPSFDAFRGHKAPAGPPKRRDWREMQHSIMMFNSAIGGELIQTCQQHP